MFSNTANSSASDKVKTRPRLKAYFNFIADHQEKIANVIGYLAVAGLFFALGRFSVTGHPPRIDKEEPAFKQINNTANSQNSQFSPAVAGASVETSTPSVDHDCNGKIKGNISATNKIYHMPGGAFYKKTTPEACFETEAAAQAAGFRKSKR